MIKLALKSNIISSTRRRMAVRYRLPKPKIFISSTRRALQIAEGFSDCWAPQIAGGHSDCWRPLCIAQPAQPVATPLNFTLPPPQKM